MPRNVNIPFSISSLKMTAEEARGHMREITSSPAERDDMSNLRRETAREREREHAQEPILHICPAPAPDSTTLHSPTDSPTFTVSREGRGATVRICVYTFSKGNSKNKGFPSPLYLFFCSAFLIVGCGGKGGFIRFGSILCLPFADCPKTPSKRPQLVMNFACPSIPTTTTRFLRVGHCSALQDSSATIPPHPHLANIFHGQPVSFPSLSMTASQQNTPHLPYRRCQRSLKWGFQVFIYCLFLLTSWADRSHRLLFNFYYLKI